MKKKVKTDSNTERKRTKMSWTNRVGMSISIVHRTWNGTKDGPTERDAKCALLMMGVGEDAQKHLITRTTN